MGNLAALTPLGHAEPQVDTIGPVTIAEIINVGLASLAARLGREAEVTEVAAGLGLPLPGPGLHQDGASFAAFWLGPQQWMVEAPLAVQDDLASHLREAMGSAASVTEQTDAWARFDVTAPDVPLFFERLCAFDLRGSAPNAATRSVIDHLGCYLIRRTPGLISVLGPRSSAHSLHHALTTAARSVF